jgi:hypothetical protein
MGFVQEYDRQTSGKLLKILNTNRLKTILEKVFALGCNMSLKLNFLRSDRHYFLENLGALRQEQEERIHQDVKEMERKYHGRWDVSVMGDCC